MSVDIRIKKGLNIKLKGRPSPSISDTKKPSHYALKPSDFTGVTPKLNVKVGDKVAIGDPLFHDKQNPQILFTAPASGVVEEIIRGEKRRILSVVIAGEDAENSKDFGSADPEKISREEIKEKLLSSGCWAFVKQRPYDIIANPAEKPKAIFISSFDSAPLTNDYSFSLSSEKEYFQTGINALAKLTDGKLHLCKNEATSFFDEIKNENIARHRVIGKHPAGNVGVQISKIDPVNQGERVWTVNAQDVVIIGKLFSEGHYKPYRTVALVGSEVKNPTYYKMTIGQKVDAFLDGKLKNPTESRIISGNVLTGEKINLDGFLGFYHNEISVIPEGNIHRFLGWIPFVGSGKIHSHSKSSLSWLFHKKEYTPNTNLNGEERAMVVTGEMESVMPMDIYPMQLLKAIIAKDLEKMEALGIYEVATEDFALIDYISSSKIEAQKIIRKGLDLMIKEVGVIKPALRSAARSVVGRYTPEQIYSSKRDAIQEEIFEETKKILTPEYIQLNEVLVRDVTLPPTIKNAIEKKLQQEQEFLEYEFKLQKAEREAKRQRIEAQGKADANRILSASLTDKILREKGIQATLELAKSKNDAEKAQRQKIKTIYEGLKVFYDGQSDNVVMGDANQYSRIPNVTGIDSDKQPTSASVYTPGVYKQKFKNFMLQWWKFYKAIAQRPDPVERALDSDRAEKGAFLLSTLRRITHTPKKDRISGMPQAMFDVGYEGAAKSNLFCAPNSRYHFHEAVSFNFTEGKVKDDQGASIIMPSLGYMGHRWWGLRKSTKSVGFGYNYLNSYTAVLFAVAGTTQDSSEGFQDFSAFPHGYFPIQAQLKVKNTRTAAFFDKRYPNGFVHENTFFYGTTGHHTIWTIQQITSHTLNTGQPVTVTIREIAETGVVVDQLTCNVGAEVKKANGSFLRIKSTANAKGMTFTIKPKDGVLSGAAQAVLNKPAKKVFHITISGAGITPKAGKPNEIKYRIIYYDLDHSS
uniref:Na(+)-translocating NADH-quinone reductase subunit A n=1 Tax=Stylophora pistillata TaxID=50429 RepID=A0A2B4RFP2_STYPI